MKKTIKANAKINLYLNVGEKREDGYHEIESIMQEISLFDEITLSLTENGTSENEIVLTSNNPRVPLNEKNIAYKCAVAFLEHRELNGYCVEINIGKHIPISGGLAGGSTDGAAVLKLLNEMTGAVLTTSELCSIGAKIGADIPFCIVGGCSICRGIGEKLTSLSPKKPRYHVLVVPSGHGVSTPQAYAMLDETELHAPCNASDLIYDIGEGNIPSVLYNAFEAVILPLRPMAQSIKDKLVLLGADGVMMSGSGPTVFGLFYDKDTLNTAKDEFNAAGIRSYSCNALI